MYKNKKVAVYGIVFNSILFVAKLIVGLLSNSLAVLSDAFNSLTDIVSSIGIFMAVKISNKKADEGHPFGHQRAEPIAGLIVAIFAGILGFEILRTAFKQIINPEPHLIGFGAIAVLIFTMVVKTFMSFYFIKQGKVHNSPAIKATGIDSRNDVFVSSVALIGVISAIYGSAVFDDIAALFVGLFILYSGYKIGMENIDYLMGKSPPAEYVKKIKTIAKRIKGVTGLNSVRAHYVGSFIHIEVHIEVNKNLSTEKSHKIGKDVQRAIESLDYVNKAFIHIDPK